MRYENYPTPEEMLHEAIAQIVESILREKLPKCHPRSVAGVRLESRYLRSIGCHTRYLMVATAAEAVQIFREEGWRLRAGVWKVETPQPAYAAEVFNLRSPRDSMLVD